jgi:hypothetical protein
LSTPKRKKSGFQGAEFISAGFAGGLSFVLRDAGRFGPKQKNVDYFCTAYLGMIFSSGMLSAENCRAPTSHVL